VTPLYGHDDAVTAFRAGMDSGRLHHAWLLAGPKGVGKALFADKAALLMLAQGVGPVDGQGLDLPDDHPTSRLVAAGSHPDLMRLERLTKESGTELARSITVDQIRSLQRLFTTTPGMSPWRAVVIDSVDDLERNAGNALLKNLEEPPPCTVFLLVSHGPERLLATINPYTFHSALTEGAMSCALGSGSNGVVTITAPKLQLRTPPRKVNKNGIVYWNCLFGANKSAAAGDDELVVTLT